MTTVPTAPVHGLILDLDDTLIDTRGAMMHAGSVAAAQLWPDAGDELTTEFGRRYFTDPGGFYQQYASGALAFGEMRRRRLGEAQQALGLGESGEKLDTFEDGYYAAFRTVQRLHDDAEGLLDAADRRGLPMVLLTNSPADHAEMKLDAVGLAGRFVRVISTDTLGVGKPDQRLFTLSAEALGVDRPNILSVGDNLDRDILAAGRAGMQAVWLHRDGDLMITDDEVALAAAEGVPTVSTLTEVIEWLPAVGGDR